MRTNIEIDDDLMARTMEVTGATTKKAAVEEAMRRTVRNATLRELVEGMRGMAWDDDLEKSDVGLHAAESGTTFDRDK